jgi:serine protease Do
MKKTTYSKLGVGAAALTLAATGGYLAHANGPEGAVNAHPVAAPAAPPLSFADIVQQVSPAVVSIEVEGRAPSPIAQMGGDSFSFGGDGIPEELRRFFQFGPGFPDQQQRQAPMRGAGSGFFISADGYLVTNNHVIDHADRITVHTADDRTFKARVIGRDAATDLAVLKVDARNLPFVSFEDRAKPRVGDWVVAVGNPFNLGGTATAGIVSALGRKNVGESSYVDYMQIDAPINRGNSGGPTFDMNGRVVGVNTAIFSPSGGSVGIGFDIPADVAAQVTRQLISTGKVARGYIGATVQDITPEIAESLGLPAAKGALVADTTPGGPSQAAGLQAGDIVLKVNGREVAGASDLTRQVGLAQPGDTIALDVRRDGQIKRLTIRSAARPSEQELADNSALGGGDGAGQLGFRVSPDATGRGVRVTQVDGASDAARKGLRPGDLIERAGAKPTRSASDLADAVAQARSAGRRQVLLMVTRGGRHVFLPVEVGAG